jgi:hypothetical protein
MAIADEPAFHTQGAMYGVAILRASFRTLSVVPKA